MHFGSESPEFREIRKDQYLLKIKKEYYFSVNNYNMNK